ncbi:unnamed protein product [Soboliphyme baturini]|uniref:Uncharacterized protein n=1 Tax=Soboliphyme baturini TaxID=241478 RepID=A0A183IGP9_9BILA|nr:unnamed protein product [Soboliphyme baturini]
MYLGVSMHCKCFSKMNLWLAQISFMRDEEIVIKGNLVRLLVMRSGVCLALRKNSEMVLSGEIVLPYCPVLSPCTSGCQQRSFAAGVDGRSDSRNSELDDSAISPAVVEENRSMGSTDSEKKFLPDLPEQMMRVMHVWSGTGFRHRDLHRGGKKCALSSAVSVCTRLTKALSKHSPVTPFRPRRPIRGRGAETHCAFATALPHLSLLLAVLVDDTHVLGQEGILRKR